MTNIKFNVNFTRKAIYDQKARESQQLARFGHSSLLPGSDQFLRACALVDTALNLNKNIRHLWLDITCAWDKPGGVAYCD